MAWDHRNKFQEDEPLDKAKRGATVAEATPTHRGRKTFTYPGCGTQLQQRKEPAGEDSVSNPIAPDHVTAGHPFLSMDRHAISDDGL